MGTTPVGRGRFVLTHLAVRVAMVLVQLSALLAIATGIGALPLTSVLAMLGAALLGLALSVLPTSLFADLMVRQMPGGHPMHPPALAILGVVATAAVMLTLAIRTFRWDQG